MKNTQTLQENFKCFFQRRFGKIIEINERYAHPKIGMTKTVKVSLLLLRAYLIFLLLLLVFKFITVIK